MAALTIDYLLMSVAPTLVWLFVGRLIAGIAGATYATAERRAFAVQRANLFGALHQVANYPGLAVLLGVVVLYQFAHDALPSTWRFFTMGSFHWSEQQVGLSLTAIGLATAIVQGALIGPIIKQIGEARAVRYGFLAGILSLGGYAFATAGWMLFPLIFVGAIFGLAMPSLRSIMSRRVPANAQGELQGAMSGVMSISAVISPLAMTQLFHWATEPGVRTPFPGAPMLLASLLLVGAAVLFIVGAQGKAAAGDVAG